MKVQVLGYRGEQELPEFVDPDAHRVIEVPDDSHAVAVLRGVFVYGGEMPSTQPEDGFTLPLDCQSYPVEIQCHEVGTDFGAGHFVTVTYLVVAKEPFELTRTIAVCDEHWGSEHQTYVEENQPSKPIEEIICQWTRGNPLQYPY